MPKALLIGVCTLAVSVAGWSSAQAQNSEASVAQAKALAERSRLRLQPRVIAYHPETDSFEFQSSVSTAGSGDRPGGDISYYGNRLTQQYRFLGPSEQGGFYEAYQWYLETLDLNPCNYQYRFGY